jgi:hypothetical protein
MSNRSIEHPTPAVPSERPMWLEERLRCAGFGEAKASELAREGRVDLHALLELIDRGCPPNLAERIVAPIDAEEIAR